MKPESDLKFPAVDDVKNASNEAMQEFETALTLCKFGRFHYRLLLAAFAACVANNLVSGSTPYLLPNAECDLRMSIMQKGMLNAIPFAGMMCSGFFAGFLTDAFGRKRFLVWGYLGMFICCLIEGSSQTYHMLLVAKFFEGFIFNGAFNANISLVSEFSHKGVRDRVMLFMSSFKAIAQVIVVLKSWAILTQDWYVQIIPGSIELHNWNFYLFVCGIWSLLACVQYSFIPESPKFLFAKGHYKQALAILRLVYAENSGKPPDSFPTQSIGNLEPAGIGESNTITKRILSGFVDVRPLFMKPLIFYLALICVMHAMLMMAYKVLRLWYPQLSTIIETYSSESSSTEDNTLCVKLNHFIARTEHNISPNSSSAQECVPRLSGAETYINSILMGCICLVPYFISGVLVSRVGKLPLIVGALTTCSACAVSLNWVGSSLDVMALVATVVALTQCSISLMQTIVVQIFPTSARSLSISLTMMAGRCGTLVGNILFPVMLEHGCMVPFFTIALMMLCVALMTPLLALKR